MTESVLWLVQTNGFEIDTLNQLLSYTCEFTWLLHHTEKTIELFYYAKEGLKTYKQYSISGT